MGEIEILPHYFFGNPRATELRDKSLLEEFKWCRDQLSRLAYFAEQLHRPMPSEYRQSRCNRILHDHVALLDRNVAPLGGDLNRGLADLGKEELINLMCREAALIAQAPEQARPIIFVD